MWLVAGAPAAKEEHMSANRCSRRYSKQWNDGRRARVLVAGAVLLAAGLMPSASFADEGGVSFWLPGLYGSLAAVPGTPGWSFTNFYYHTTVTAGADVAEAREITIGRFNSTANLNLSANLNANADFVWINPSYVFMTPVLGGQATVGLGTLVGQTNASLSGTLTARFHPSLSFAPTASAITCSGWATFIRRRR